jgi:Flp pilus assembly protein TadB
LSARLLTALPLGFSAWGVLTSSSVRAAFRDTPLTAICLAVGLSLNALGWWWMRRLVMVDAA